MRCMSVVAGSIVVAIVLLAGCGGDREGTTDESRPLVVYARSGGVAANPERLTIERDGAATVVAGVDGQRSSFELSESELAELSAELEAADFGALEDPGPSACADCFFYEVVYGDLEISYDDLDTPPASVSTLVAHLGQIAGRHDR